MNKTSFFTVSTDELLSALADGELRSDELAAALACCQDDRQAAFTSWNAYHLIRDALRVSAGPALGGDTLFLQKLNRRLATKELSDNAVDWRDSTSLRMGEAQPASPDGRGEASNDESFRWKVVAGLASLAAVSAIAWSTIGPSGLEPKAQLAALPTPAQVLVASPQGPVVRDARLEELLAAHRQLGGMPAFQAPSGFLRNAAFDAVPARRP